MKIIFFWYNDLVREIYWDNEDYIFFDQYGWWLFINDKRKLISVDQYEYSDGDSYPQNFDIINIISELRSLGPIWSRWCGKGDQYELLLRQSALLVLQISQALISFGNGTAIFSTAVSHHIDTSICELACRLAGWKQIFLYPSIFSDRLIPLEQHKSMVDRCIMNENISDYILENEIIEWKDRAQNGLLPKVNYKINKLETTFSVSIIYLINYLIIHKLKKIIAFLSKRIQNILSVQSPKPVNIFKDFNNNYFFQYLNQMLVQRAALRYYDKTALNKLPSDKSNFRTQLIFASHLQPEAATFPEGGKFGDQTDIIIKIRKMKYKGAIYYKEHPGSRLYLANWQPKMVGMNRSIIYYQQLEKLGCLFLSTKLNLATLAEKGEYYLPITITGTIAIERSLLGLHTIVAGIPWYIGLPGVIPLSNLHSLDNLPIEWTRPDANISRQALKFFTDKLNNRTIVNTLGIGTGYTITDENSKNLFKKEFQLLLSHLRNW